MDSKIRKKFKIEKAFFVLFGVENIRIINIFVIIFFFSCQLRVRFYDLNDRLIVEGRQIMKIFERKKASL